MKRLWIGVFALLGCGFGGLGPDRQYRLVDFKNGARVREFMVSTRSEGEDLVLHGDAKDDYRLSPIDDNQANLTRPRPYQTPETVKVKSHVAGIVAIFADEQGGAIHLFPVEQPTEVARVTEWYSPFPSGDRKSLAALKKRVGANFGVYRSSPKKGHKHAGTDLKGELKEPVHAIAVGKVEFVSHYDENGTVLVKHFTSGGVVFSKYVHLKDITIVAGDFVDETTLLGRLFDGAELKKSGNPFNHVHLEIRKNYDDKGKASSQSMSMKALAKHCFSPLEFFKERLSK